MYDNIKSDWDFFYKDSLDRPLNVEDKFSTLGDSIECREYLSPEYLAVESVLEDNLYDYMNQLTPRQRVVLDVIYNLSGQYESPLSLRDIQAVTGISR